MDLKPNQVKEKETMLHRNQTTMKLKRREREREKDNNNFDGYCSNQIDMRIINWLQHNSGSKMPSLFKIILKEAFQSKLPK